MGTEVCFFFPILCASMLVFISSTKEGWKAESNSAFQQGIRLDFPALHTGVIVDQCTELILNQSNYDIS